MKKAPIPLDEGQRISTLQRLLIIDTPPEKRFDLLTSYATLKFNVAISVICLVDTDRQWFKSKVGLSASETAREISFCGHAILDDDCFIVEDASADERFHDNPLVTQPPSIRFYAGAPLLAPNGQRIGTFAVIDNKPHTITEAEKSLLKDLARVAMLEILGISATSDFLNRRFCPVDAVAMPVPPPNASTLPPKPAVWP